MTRTSLKLKLGFGSSSPVRCKVGPNRMAEQSLAQSHVSEDSTPLPKKILVAVDGSDESLAAARFAIELAGKFRAELSTLHVILIPEYVSEEVRNRLKQDLGSRGELALKKVRESIQGKE